LLGHVVTAATVALLGASDPSARTEVTASLAPVASASARQGSPFAFKATVSSTATGQLTFSLVPQAGAPIAFERKQVEEGAHVLTGSVVSSAYFRGRGRYRVVASVDGARVGSPLAFDVRRPLVQPAVFRDVTAASGIRTTTSLGECGDWSSGAAWGDVNGDGRPDLVVTRLERPLQLYVSVGGGRFRDEAAARGLDNGSETAIGVSFADYDDDGDPDLFVANGGSDRLFRNDHGRFTDVTAQAGVADAYDSMSASWGDYDHDGRLDLYVTDYAHCLDPPSRPLTYELDRLYLNDGGGRFTEVTSLLGPNATIGAGFAAAWFDYNGDGWDDLYLANDFFGQQPDRNHLWRNDRGKAFTDVSVPSRSGLRMNTMGIAVGDYDRDGRLDLALSNSYSNVLLRNRGDGTFADTAGPARVARTYQQAGEHGFTWGLELADLNLDGWEDLYVGAGYLWALSWLGEQPYTLRNEVFVNDRHGAFLDLSAPSRADDPGTTRGIAVGDYDRDGRLDVFVSNQDGQSRLYRNVTPRGRNHWLEVRTVGTVSNRDGCGARLTVTVRGGSLVREVLCGSTSLSSGRDEVVHFGLGPARTFTLRIAWPSGRKSVYRRLKADRLVTLVEPRR
jgi:enediyne biosynthesis protein E4